MNATSLVAPLRRRLGRARRAWRAKRGGSAVAKTPVAAGSTTTKPIRIGPVTTELGPELEQVIAGVLDEHLTYLSVGGLRTLASVVTELEAAGVPGLVLEAGVARGGSAIVLATAKSAGRPLQLYDVFAMIPPPGEKDGADVHERYQTIVSGQSQGVGGETYYGYRDDLMGEVTESFARHGVPVADNNVELVPGLFEDTLGRTTMSQDGPVALAHLDGDWYSSTMTCLTAIVPRLPPGGRLVIDDYDAWSGCKTAIDEFFAGRTDFRFERRGKLHIVKL
jgi:hypothetical protein